MKKKIVIALMALCMVAGGAAAMTGCGSDGSSESESVQTEQFGAPQNLKFNSKGVLSWTKVEGATAYEVSVDGSNYTQVSEEEIDVFTLVKNTSVTKIYVRAKQDNKTSEASEIAVTVKQLATPSTPVEYEDEETHAVGVKWDEVTDANRYGVKVNGNDKWVSSKFNYWNFTSTGTYTVQVNCLGYVDDTTIYLESAASAVSAEVSFVLGPTLISDKIEEIYWTVEENSPFVSYDLYIDGVLADEGLDIVSSASPLNLVTAGYITKTGEYDIQIKANLEGGSYAWSNVLVELGTLNINENEIYSFDNRVANLIVYKSGVTVSDEYKYGESGYSLRIDRSQFDGQMNLRSYYEASSSVDFRQTFNISYWIYIPSDENAAGETVDVQHIPHLMFDDAYGEYKNRYHFFGVSDYSDPTKVPYDTWTKVTFTNAINEYDSVLVWVTNGPDLVCYVDEMQIEPMTDVVTDYDYKFCYNGEGGDWFKSNTISLAEEINAEVGETVRLSAKIATSLDGTEAADSPYLFAMQRRRSNAEDWTAFGGLKTEIPVAASTGWREISFLAKVAEDGNIYISSGVYQPTASTSYYLYLKDIAVADYVTASLNASGGSWFNGTTALVASGLTPGAKAVLTAKVKTSLDGQSDVFATVGTHSGTSMNNDEWNNGFAGHNNEVRLDTSASGWRDIKLTAIVAEDGNIYIYVRHSGGNDYAPKSIAVDFKDVNVEIIVAPSDAEFTAEYSGVWEIGKTVAIKTGLNAGDVYNLEFYAQTSVDAKNYGLDTIYIADGDASGLYAASLWGVALDITTAGWKKVTRRVTVAEDGCIYLGASQPSNGNGTIDVYFKDVKAELIDYVTASLDASAGAWFNGPTALVATGLTAGAKGTLTAKIRTSADGGDGSVVANIASHSDANISTDGWNNGFAGHSSTLTLDTSKSGWREIELPVVVAADGNVYIAVFYSGAGTAQSVSVDFKDVEVEEAPPAPEDTEYTGYFKGTWGNNSAATIKLDGTEAGDIIKITFKYQTALDGKATTESKHYHFIDFSQKEGDTDHLGYNAAWGVTFNITDTGWKTMGTMTVKVAADGNIYLGVCGYIEDGKAFDFYIKDVEIVDYATASLDASSGAWFNGPTALVATGLTPGATGTLTAMIRTSADGGDGSVVAKIASHSDANISTDGWNNGFAGHSSTLTLDTSKSGWREIELPVVVAADGNVYIAVFYSGSGTPQSVSVDFKDASVEIIDYVTASFTSGWFNGTTAKVLEGQTAGATLNLTMEIRTSLDGTAGLATKLVGHTGATMKDADWTGSHPCVNYAVSVDTSQTGWRTLNITVVVASDGCVYIAACFTDNASQAYTVDIRNVEIVDYVTASLDASGGAWFNGPTALVATGLTAGATGTLTAMIRTSADGGDGSVVANIASHSDANISNAEWTTFAGHNSTLKLDTSKSGWREIELPVVVAADGNVYIAVFYSGSGTPQSVSVDIKDATIVF